MRASTFERRLDLLVAQAEQAERDHAWSAAAAFWWKAIDEAAAADVSELLGLYESAERASELADRMIESLILANRAVHRLAPRADDDTLVRLHERQAYFLAANGAGAPQVFEALRVAIGIGEQRPASPAYVRALIVGVGLLHEQGVEPARNELLARAIDAAARLDEPGLLRASVLPWVAYLRLMDGNAAGCVAALREAWELPATPGDHASTVRLAALLIDASRRMGDGASIDAIAVAGFAAVVRGGLGDSWLAVCLRRTLSLALEELVRTGELTLA